MQNLVGGLLLGGLGAYGYSTDWTFTKVQNQETSKQQSNSKVPQVDYESIRGEIEEIIPNADHDYGSIGPVLVRLAWHASGTYDAKTQTGGSNGATMRYKKEGADPANNGLDKARKFLEPIKEKHPEISYSDLWILSSYVALEFMGCPRIPFTPGRVDSKNDDKAPENGRLPDASKDSKHIRDVFGRMGFTDREIVVLIGGGHGFGKCHKENSGYEGPWTNSPTYFSNMFFKELFDNKWNEKKWDGKKQFEDKNKRLMMLPTDMELKTDPEFKKWSLIYKDSPQQFNADFCETFKKLTELGFAPNY